MITISMRLPLRADIEHRQSEAVALVLSCYVFILSLLCDGFMLSRLGGRCGPAWLRLMTKSGAHWVNTSALETCSIFYSCICNTWTMGAYLARGCGSRCEMDCNNQRAC